VEAVPVPFGHRRLQAKNLRQFFPFGKANEGGMGWSIGAIDDTGTVTQFAGYVPSATATIEIIRALNRFYDLPTQRVEGYELDLQEAVGDDSFRSLDRLQKQTTPFISQNAGTLVATYAWDPGPGRLLNLVSIVTALGLGALLMATTQVDLAGRQNVIIGIFGLGSLLSLYFGQVFTRNHTKVSASSDKISVLHGPLPFAKPIEVGTAEARQFLVRGSGQKQLCLVDKEGFARPICRRFPIDEAAIQLASELNRFYKLPPEAVTIQADLWDGEVLRPKQKEIRVSECDGLLTISYAPDRSGGFLGIGGTLFFVVIEVVMVSTPPLATDLASKLIFSAMIAPCIALFGWITLGAFWNKFELEAHPSQLLCRIAPFPLFSKRVRVIPVGRSSVFASRQSSNSSNPALCLVSPNKETFLPNGPNAAATLALTNELNRFYRTGPFASQKSEALDALTVQATNQPQTLAKPGESKIFQVIRRDHSLSATYRQSPGLAILGLGYGPLFSFFVLAGFVRSFALIPVLSVVLLLLLGPPLLYLSWIGVAAVVNRTRFEGTRYEIVVTFGPMSFSKPKKVSPSQILEWIARGDPTDMRQTYLGTLGYRDKDHIFVPLLTQIPSSAFAHQLKAELEAFYKTNSDFDTDPEATKSLRSLFDQGRRS
jgi:hypothetical protein